MKRTAGLLAVALVAAVSAATWTLFRFADEATPTKSSTQTAEPPRRGANETPTTLFGEIRRTGTGALVASQRVVLLADGGAAREATTDAQGVFRFTDVAPSGPYELRVDASECASLRLSGLVVDRGALFDVGTLRLGPPVRVVVRVRNRADEPVAGAAVEAFARLGRTAGRLADVKQTAAPPNAVAATDAAGEATFDGLADGAWTFAAKAPGLARDGVERVRIRAGAAGPFTVRLGVARPLAGRALDSDGRPVADITVLCGASGFDDALRMAATTGADGRFAFDGPAAGTTWVYVVARGGPPSLAACLKTPDVSRIDVRLPRGGSLRGRILDADSGAPIEGAVVRGRASSPWERTGAAATASDDKGGYVLDGLVGSQIHVEVSKSGWFDVGNSGREHPDFAAAEEVEFARDFRLRRASRLSGVVRSAVGPVSGAVVSFHGGPPDFDAPHGTAVTDSEGRYELFDVPVGIVRLDASKPGFCRPDLRQEVETDDDESAPPLVVDVAASGETHRDLDLAPCVAVTGRVVDQDGAPVSGAAVFLPDALDSALTGPDGAFRIEGVPPGRRRLACRKDGFRLATGDGIDVGRSGDATCGELKMERTAPRFVRGRVRTSDGSAPPDALAGVAPWNGFHERLEAVRGRETVARSGEFVVPVPEDESKFAVGVVAPGYAPAVSAVIDLDAGPLPSDVTLVLDRGATITGHVVAGENGAPIVGAYVYAAPRVRRFAFSGTPNDAVAATTDADGAFRIERLAPGGYVVGAEAPGRAPSGEEADTARDIDVRIVLASALSIQGRVRYVDRRPAEGLQVDVTDDSSRGWFRSDDRAGKTAVVDAAGRFHLTGLPKDQVTLEVNAPSRGGFGVVPRVMPNVVTGDLDVSIFVEEGATISGRVVDGRGRPMAEVNVEAQPPGAGFVDFRRRRRTTSRADGTFVVRGLSPGVFDLDAEMSWRSDGNRRPTRITGVRAGASDVEIVVENGLTISGVVVDADGKPMSQIALWAGPDETDAPGGWRTCSTGPDGKFEFCGLAPGRHRISSGRGPGPPRFVLAADAGAQAGATEVRLTATKAAEIAGVVVDEAGAPVAEAQVDAWLNGRNAWVTAATRDDGTFVLGGLRADEEYEVSAESEGRVDATMPGVRGGTTGVRLVAPRGRSASGRILRANGRPLAATRIAIFARDFRGSRFTKTDADGRFRFSGLADGVYEVSAFPEDSTAPQRSVLSCGKIRAGDVGVELQISR